MTEIHHVQLAMPAGAEDEARDFFGRVLGMEEIAKPAPLVDRGGVWFRHGDLELHLGVEEPFSPARKAHPGILTEDLATLRDRLESAGYPTTTDDDFPGHRRFYAPDCFGNRLEFLEPLYEPVPTLTTPRLVLRPLREGDADAVFEYANDEEFALFVPTLPWPYTRNDATEFVRRTSRRRPDLQPTFGIEHGDRLIGACNLAIDQATGTAELGYGLGRPGRGRGLATEAAARLLRHAFEDHDLVVVWARADAANLASQRVLEKIGMRYEGTLRGRVVRFGQRRDDRYYSVVRGR